MLWSDRFRRHVEVDGAAAGELLSVVEWNSGRVESSVTPVPIRVPNVPRNVPATRVPQMYPKQKSHKHLVLMALAMGGRELESPTSTMSTWRSNQLS